MTIVIRNQKSTTPTQEISHSRKLLNKMVHNWSRRAQVVQAKSHNLDLNNPELAFDTTRDDFRSDLLPFKDHPAFLGAPFNIQQKILSCGWIAYNEKTVDIESKVVSPACNHIIYQEVPGVDNGVGRQIASDTLVDEAYHILLVMQACRITREQRGLQSLKLPSFNLVKQMILEQGKYSEPWQKILVQIATATVSEVFISDYLNLLAKDTDIQPMNRLVVDTHRKDEMAHHSIFTNLAQCIYTELSPQQQEFFADVFPLPVRWFANSELEVWQTMLEYIGFPKTREVIADCAVTDEVNLSRIDYSGVISLAEELGVLNSQQGIDSFARQGLLK
ncbi:MAG: diiron oxygenase [Okeania sp. SIO3B5]|uniref:AurF N-oxygenase family protein n=1 Tax=Okeania sp. SIO3B5 TaxID=2607811 RepID=UPI0014004AFE|nr:diiron oxygenase [Okeania sp. SIO3B5]NEO51788.1 diiron oxygenase [Okeania sp. SIO3B5]